MEKKLALMLGVLLLLPSAHFFCADLQVKANQTINLDHGSSDGLRSQGKSSVSEDGIRERKKDQVVVNDEISLSSKINPKNGVKTRKLDAGLDNQKKKETDTKESNKVEFSGGIKLVNERLGESKKGSDVKIGLVKDYDSELGNKEGNKSENMVEPRENVGNNEFKVVKSSEDGDENKGDQVDKEAVKDLGSSSDDCYSSYKCSDSDNMLIACLRVPGNDSPLLSLLIQNKGNESLTVDISAPDFVQLESTIVQLRMRENKQVKVSIGSGGKQSSIVLRSGTRVCDLDFKDLMRSHHYKYLRLPSRRPMTIVFLSFSALMIMASAWMCLNARRRKLSSRAVGYQKLDSGLPVAGVTPEKRNDGWDESWGDNWDDEEAQPLTPSKPSPSFSSKRLASRRMSKETRKD